MNAQSPPGGPWYRYFWPWFIVSLLTAAVVGSLFTVVLAFAGRDPEIVRTPIGASLAAPARPDAGSP